MSDPCPNARRFHGFGASVCDPWCVDDNPRLLSDLPLVVVVARAVVYGLCLGLAIIDGTVDERPGLLLGLLLIAVLASLPVKVHWLAWWRPVMEAVAATWLHRRVRPAGAVAAAVPCGTGTGGGAAAAGCCLVVLVTGLVLGRVRARRAPAGAARGRPRLHLLRRSVGRPRALPRAAWPRGSGAFRNQVAASSSSYASAYRLMSQLRVVSRQLSGGLDPVTLSARACSRRCAGVAFDRARGLRALRGRPAVPLAFAGVDRVDWDARSRRRLGLGRGVDLGQPSAQRDLHRRAPAVTSAVLPLRIGRAHVRPGRRWSAPRRRSTRRSSARAPSWSTKARCGSRPRCCSARCGRWRPRRSGAGWPARSTTASPRSSPRSATSSTTWPAAAPTTARPRADLQALRSELTRDHHRAAAVDLRPAQRGAADHRARRGAVRLRPPGRRQLRPDRAPGARRVAEPAARSTPRPSCCGSPRRPITNARKHAGAQNLWVTCRIDPPRRTCCGRGRRRAGLAGRATDSYRAGDHARAGRAASAPRFDVRATGTTAAPSVEVVTAARSTPGDRAPTGRVVRVSTTVRARRRPRADPAGPARAFERSGGLQVVGEAGNVAEALRIARGAHRPTSSSSTCGCPTAAASTPRGRSARPNADHRASSC